MPISHTIVPSDYNSGGVKDKQFFLVENSHGSALAAGDVVMWTLDSVAGSLGGKSVAKITTAARVRVAGVVVGKTLSGGASIADGEYGFIQTRGFCSLITTDGNVAAGDVLMGLDTGVAAPAADGADTRQFGYFGVALAADASTTLSSAVLRC